MVNKRVLCGYGIDVDAVSSWINTQTGEKADATNVSRGIFGATVGVDRLLGMWKKYNIKATFFTPGHSIESFPKQIAKIRDGGHEIAVHGYTHEIMTKLTTQQQKDVLTKCVDIITAFTGKPPVGYTAPGWATTKDTVRLLEEAGITYDHSFMHHDCQMYWVPKMDQSWVETDYSKDPSYWMKPMGELTHSNVVEVPANWHLDDWPPLGYATGRPSQGFVDPDTILKIWKSQFDFYYREYDTFVFPISIHPQVSGKAQVMLVHEKLIEYINSHEGVEWMTLADMAEEFRAGRIEGYHVEGGAEKGIL
ncbi:glucose 1-dehydrogenase [Calocera viscosa TUFC12733]|uniref:Glucose 1-dehydrogenase n=1 Tax=Calocera viscosa (strain TUFC12733) TaxID=1330018 RepID=A0A167P795_CALVF|nr:glucose 1-dehydrogenase [Calocera viscosa TUFC12733]